MSRRAQLSVALAAFFIAVFPPAFAMEIGVYVASPAGDAIEGARVTLLGPKGDGSIVSGDTNEAGKVVLKVEKVGLGRLVVTSADWLAHVEAINYEAGDLIHVVLQQGRHFTLSVKDSENGRAVGSFRALFSQVSVGDDDALAMALLEPVPIESDEGTTVLRCLPDEPVDMLILADGYRPFMASVAGDQDALRVDLDGTGCSRHQVVDSQTGEAIAGARAIPAALLEENDGLSRVVDLMFAKSDGEGMITLCPMGGSKDVMALVHPDYVHRSVITSGDAKIQENAKIMMFQGASLRVRAHSSLDHPVADARVVVEIEGLRHDLTTDHRGEANFEKLVPAENARIEVVPPGGFIPSAISTTTLRTGETTKISIYLPPEYRLRLIHAEQPVPDTPVVLLDWATGKGEDEGKKKFTPIAEGRSDGDGTLRFPLEFEPSDEAMLAIGGENSFHFLRWPRPAKDSSAFDLREIELVGTYVQGRVVSKSDNASISGARLTCISPGAESIWARWTPDRGPLWLEPLSEQRWQSVPGVIGASNERGKFDIFLPSHCSELSVSGPPPQPGYAPWQEETVKRSALEETEILIHLDRGARFEVTIDVESGDFPSSLDLSLWRWPDAPGPSYIGDVVTRATQTLDPPDEGPWFIVAKAPGFAPGVEGPLDAPPGAQVPVTLLLEQGAFILTRHESDQAVESIRLADANGIDWLRWVKPKLLEENLIEIGPLPRGRYVLGYEEETRRVDLRVPGVRLETSLPSSR